MQVTADAAMMPAILQALQGAMRPHGGAGGAPLMQMMQVQGGVQGLQAALQQHQAALQAGGAGGERRRFCLMR